MRSEKKTSCGMKSWFKNRIPTREQLQQNKSLRFLGEHLYQSNLWHFNRHSAPRALAIGLFWAMIPMPMQMLAAALVAAPLRAYLPLSIGSVWLTNPVTMPPIFYGNYLLGAWLLNTPAVSMPDEWSLEWLADMSLTHWQPLYFGSLVAAIGCAIIGYFGMNLYYRRSVLHKWNNRKGALANSGLSKQATK